MERFIVFDIATLTFAISFKIQYGEIYSNNKQV